MTIEPPPLVSIIVPVYNVEQYLDCCLASIRSQTWKRLEIIVIEDGSTDGSQALLQSHLVDPRVRLIQHERNSGLSAARNTGIEAARGDYVLFVDSDDAISATLVETCVSVATAQAADVVVFDFVPFQDGAPLPSTVQASSSALPLDQESYFKLPHFAWLKFFRRTLLDSPRLRFPVGYYYEDWPFHWELGLLAQRMVELDGNWYCYRQRLASISASSGRKLLDQFAVQEMVLNRIAADRHGAGARVLSTKMHESFWTILTRIDSELLPEAVARAGEIRRQLKRIDTTLPAHGRGAIMGWVLVLPASLAVTMVRLIRLAKSSAAPLRKFNATTEAPT